MQCDCDGTKPEWNRTEQSFSPVHYILQEWEKHSIEPLNLAESLPLRIEAVIICLFQDSKIQKHFIVYCPSHCYE